MQDYNHIKIKNGVPERKTVCTARKTIRIGGDDYPAELVKSKFMKLNSSHIEFVMDRMREFMKFAYLPAICLSVSTGGAV